jgi:hypothetical protein
MPAGGEGHNTWGGWTMQGEQVVDNTTRGVGASKASRQLTRRQEGGVEDLVNGGGGGSAAAVAVDCGVSCRGRHQRTEEDREGWKD